MFTYLLSLALTLGRWNFPSCFSVECPLVLPCFNFVATENRSQSGSWPNGSVAWEAPVDRDWWVLVKLIGFLIVWWFDFFDWDFDFSDNLKNIRTILLKTATTTTTTTTTTTITTITTTTKTTTTATTIEESAKNSLQYTERSENGKPFEWIPSCLGWSIWCDRLWFCILNDGISILLPRCMLG